MIQSGVAGIPWRYARYGGNWAGDAGPTGSSPAVGEFLAVSIILRFHLGQELNEIRRLTDAVQKSIAGVSGIEMKTADRRFSQPFDGFSTLTDRKSTRLNSSHIPLSRMPSSA